MELSQIHSSGDKAPLQCSIIWRKQPEWKAEWVQTIP